MLVNVRERRSEMMQKTESSFILRASLVEISANKLFSVAVVYRRKAEVNFARPGALHTGDRPVCYVYYSSLRLASLLFILLMTALAIDML
jgi:hypothetical protein